MEFIGRDVKQNSFYTIPSLWKFKQVLMNRNTECIYGSVFEVFDIMIGTPIEFSERIRTNRNHRQFKKKSSDVLNPSDFYSIPLFPSSVWLLNGREYDSIVQQLGDYLSNKSSVLENMTSCKDSITHDSMVLERLHGMMNFTSLEIGWSRKFFNLSIPIPHNTSFLQQALYIYNQNKNEPLFWNQSTVRQHLWTSTCYPCSSFSCVSERWAWADSLDITITSMGIFYYFLLFASGAFRSPVIYRKYPIIFFGPITIMGIYTSMVNAFNNSCVSIGIIFTVYLAALLNLMYICTVVRYYYLRSLYNIVKDSKHPKLFKYLAGEVVGFLFTIILPIPLAFIASIPFFILITTYNSLIVNTTNNVIIIIFCALSCMAGVIFFIYEAVKNRKIISKFGFGRFLIFEDPYYFRVDLLSLAMIFVLLVLLAVVFLIVPTSIVAIRFLIGLALYLVTGGTSLLMVFIENVRNGNTKKSTLKHSNVEFIDMIKNNSNQDLVELFKIYCEKSLALENIMLMDTLVGFKRKSENIKLEDLKTLHDTFLSPYSAYEVNVSSATRNDFEKGLHDAEVGGQSQKISNQILNQIMIEVEMNLISTFSRFARTNEFRQWNEIYQLQKNQVAIL